MDDHSGFYAQQTMEALLNKAHAPGLTHRFDQLIIGNTPFDCRAVIKQTPLLTQGRKARIERVLSCRTFRVAPVVEGLVNTGNVCAVMRTAEGLGFQPFYVINNGENFKYSERITHGAEKWLSLWQWPDPPSCATFLRKQGYRIVATALNASSIPLTDLDFTQPTALVWGNEAQGVTDAMLAKADQTCYIPMSGFTESLNISVAAAVSLFHAYEQRIQAQGYHGDLTPE